MNTLEVGDISSTPFIWGNVRLILSKQSKDIKARFAPSCAKQVRHLTSAPTETQRAINTIEMWFKGEATVEACRLAKVDILSAHEKSYEYIYHSYAANAIISTIEAVLDGEISSYTSYADAANSAAVYALMAISHDNPNEIQLYKQEQISYLKQLVIDGLPEELKDNWLLVASI